MYSPESEWQHLHPARIYADDVDRIVAAMVSGLPAGARRDVRLYTCLDQRKVPVRPWNATVEKSLLFSRSRVDLAQQVRHGHGLARRAVPLIVPNLLIEVEAWIEHDKTLQEDVRAAAVHLNGSSSYWDVTYSSSEDADRMRPVEQMLKRSPGSRTVIYLESPRPSPRAVASLARTAAVGTGRILVDIVKPGGNAT